MSKIEERKISLAPAQWERLKRILEQALQEETPAARLAAVENLCADDAGILAEAKSLLRQSEEILSGEKSDPLEAGATEGAALLRGDSVRERRVGAYRLVEETGRGGMGTVYLAERADGCFEKRVAIKIIKRGTDTDEVLRRFEAERAIRARLDHPNIARLMDAGTTDEGLPFFVMEYVDGKSILRFARERQMPVRDRIELFLKVCAAVEFAHEARVIHRDLKAGNILVNEAGEPKLLDFGIAKLLATEPADAEATITWQQIFSPACASPEQVRGERATAASDVYALGALLYELLSDRPPHIFTDGAPSRAELNRVVCETDPALPSAAALEPATGRILRGDLDAIVLRALTKEPGERYSSVGALATDLQRYLAGEPVRARRLTPAYRVARFTARNRRALLRVGLATVGIIAAALIISALVVSNPRLREALKISTTDAADNSIAVLPFKDLGGGENSAALTDGVQDQILADLAKASRLKVISRASVERYNAGAVHNVRELGQNLGVRYVLEGSVQRAGDRARISVRLIDARRDSQLWSKSYERDLTDLFAMQSQIAQAVAAELKIALLPEEKVGIEQPPTRDLAAYELFLRAKENVNGYLDAQDQEQSLRHAIRLLEEAVARDPEFMLAYCFTARAHSLLYALRLDATDARKLLARNAADTALRLQPDSAEAHLALADHYYRCGGKRFEMAEQELALARPRLTNSPAFHLLDASIHRRRGRWSESDRSFTRAVELDPNNSAAINLLADNFILERQYAKAIHVLEQAQARGLGSPILRLRIAAIEFARSADVDRFEAALKEAPADLDIGGSETPLRILVALARRDFAGAHRALAASNRSEFQDVDFTFYYPRAWYEGAIARAEGRTDLVRDAFSSARRALEEKLKQRPGNARTLAVLGQVDAALGNTEAALAEARQATETTPLEVDAYDAPIILQGLAQVYCWMGEKERALDVVEKLTQIPGYLSYGYLRVDPSWDPLRGEPRFETIVQSLHPALGPKD